MALSCELYLHKYIVGMEILCRVDVPNILNIHLYLIGMCLDVVPRMDTIMYVLERDKIMWSK